MEFSAADCWRWSWDRWWRSCSGRTSAGAEPPQPELNFAGQVMAPRPCALDTQDPDEARLLQARGLAGRRTTSAIPGACERLRFAYGPIVVKPGQNDVLVEPVTIEKPNQDGYITRFKPNLVDQNGNVPPVEQVHLHHGTWLSEPSATAAARSSPPARRRRSRRSRAATACRSRRPTTWLLLYMVHSAVSQPMVVYITYDIDFVPKAKGDALGHQAGLPGLARRAARRATRCSTSSAASATNGTLHVAEAGVRGVRPVRQGRSSARASRATASART